MSKHEFKNTLLKLLVVVLLTVSLFPENYVLAAEYSTQEEGETLGEERPDQVDKAAPKSITEQKGESAAEGKTEQKEESAAEGKTKQKEKAVVDGQTEQKEKSAADGSTEQGSTAISDKNPAEAGSEESIGQTSSEADAEEQAQENVVIETQPKEESVKTPAVGTVTNTEEQKTDQSDLGQVEDPISTDGNVDSGSTWGAKKMCLPEAAEYAGIYADNHKGEEVTVAVIDTGLDIGISGGDCFKDRIIDGYDYVHDTGDYLNSDDNEDKHGSYVAGIIASNTPDNVKIVILKALDQNKKGSVANVAKAIREASSEYKADIINMSFAVSEEDLDKNAYQVVKGELDDAIDEVSDECIIVASAGNNGKDLDDFECYPAKSDNCITVMAVDENGNRISDSNFGSDIDFAAPGENIKFDESNEYGLTGTSMAAPFITAACAIVDLCNLGGSRSEIESYLRKYTKADNVPIMQANGTLTGKWTRPFFSVEEDSLYVKLDWSEQTKLLYDIYRKEAGTAIFTKVGSSDSGIFEDKNISTGVEYEYYISCVDPKAAIFYQYPDSDPVKVRTGIKVRNMDICVDIGGTDFSIFEDLIYIGESKKYTYKIIPENASNQKVSWKSSNPEVATVNESGEVTALKCGYASIEIIADDNPEIKRFVSIFVFDHEKCGENVYWKYVEEDEALYITGNGDMYDVEWSGDGRLPLWPWKEYMGKIHKIVIGDGVTGIGRGAFQGSNTLTPRIEVKGMKDVKEIREYAFKNISISGALELPNDVSISENAFSPVSINELILPKELNSESLRNALNAKILEKFTVDPDNQEYSTDENGVLFNKEKTVLIKYPSSKEGGYTIPNTVKTIKKGAFYYSLVSEIIVPDSVNTIEEEAFEGCSQLEEIVFPNSVTTIGDRVCYGCSGLKRVVLPEGITSIGEYAFWGTHLESVEIPKNVKRIEDFAFSRTYIEELSIPEGVTKIGLGPFNECQQLKKVSLPKSLNEIKSFGNCKNLKDILYSNFTENYMNLMKGSLAENDLRREDLALYISTSGMIDDTGISWKAEGPSDDVTLIVTGSGAMPDYENSLATPWKDGRGEITKVVIGEGVTHLGNSAFADMANLESVELPRSIADGGNSNSYGKGVFYADQSLEKITYVAGGGLENLDIYVQYLLTGENGPFEPQIEVERLEEEKEEDNYHIIYIDDKDHTEGQKIITIDFQKDLSSYGSVKIPFQIVGKELEGVNIKKIDRLELVPPSSRYTGLVHHPEKVYSGRWTLKEGVDYDLKKEELLDAGQYHIQAIGKGLYKGEKEADYTITPADLSKREAKLSQESYTYDGKEKKPDVTIEGLTLGTDYELSYSNNIQPGTAAVTVSGIGNYSGNKELNYTILEKVEEPEPEKTEEEQPKKTEEEQPKKTTYALPEMVFSTQSFVYNGTRQQPGITLRDSNRLLKEGTDYTVTSRPADSTDVGEYTITVEGLGEYTGSRSKSYSISPADIGDLLKKSYLSQTTYTYDGKAKEPELIIPGLERNTDFYITYKNNKEPGTNTAKVIAEGRGNYTGSIEKTFSIVDSDEKVLTSITLSDHSYVYDGSRHTPEAEVSCDGEILEEGRDYKIEYDDGRTDAGTYRVTAEGMGAYKGSVTDTFTIRRKKLDDVAENKVSLSEDAFIYDGTEKRPTLLIENLKEGSDYQLSYSDNIQPGTAKVVAEGIGNYSGTITRTFVIREEDKKEEIENTEQAEESDKGVGIENANPEGTREDDRSGAYVVIGTVSVVVLAMAGFYIIWKNKKKKE